MLSGPSDGRHEDYLLDLAKALYKLHFQLLLLIEATNKMNLMLSVALKSAQFKDSSSEVVLVKSALIRTIEDTEADGGTPTPVSSAPVSPNLVNTDDLELALYELLVNEKWSTAISFIKHNKGYFSRDQEHYYLDIDDDVVLMLNIYCKRLVQERTGAEYLNLIDGK